VTPRQAFLRACALDVAVRKPGNVSLDAPGHGMQAAQFIDSAEAAADALFQPGLGVGDRIEAAVTATRAVVGCNTNLGIVLLCAPIAAAAEQTTLPLRESIGRVLAALTVDDAAAAYHAIALAQPGGLGHAASQDVHDTPTVDLRAAMALAAERDRIARQYRDGFAEVFELALPALPRGFLLPALPPGSRPDATTVAAVQALYLLLLSTRPDSHIVRKQGEAVAQNVMAAAQAWLARRPAAGSLDADPAFAAWDRELKARGVNPGTTADLTVATLMVAGLAIRPPRDAHRGAQGDGTECDTSDERWPFGQCPDRQSNA
jgi:triphosphoribosyl-dephospho-CoA synthase